MKTFPLVVTIAATTLLIICTAGCKSYIKYKYGITQPREETPGKLLVFLEKHNFPTDNLYLFSDSGSYSHAVRNPEFRKHLPGHMIFDRDGALLQRDTMQCQWAGYDMIKSLNRDATYEKSPGFQLGEILGHIQPFGKNSVPDDTLKDPDFTVIVTWAKFIGTYNYRLFRLSDAPKLNNTARIRMIWLNIDMQESWHLTAEQKVAIK